MSKMCHGYSAKEYCKIEEKLEDSCNELHFTRLALCDKDNEIKELKKLLEESAAVKSSSSSHHDVINGSSNRIAGSKHLDRCDANDNNHNCHHHHFEQNLHRPSSRSSHDYQQMADLIEHLRVILQEKENALIECQERNRFFCQSIARLQEECHTKDALVVELQNEIDKFRQVVKPLTQVFLQHHKTDCDDFNCTIGMESTRVIPSASEPKRIKRQGYSAEPLIDLVEAEDKLMKIPKSAK